MKKVFSKENLFSDLLIRKQSKSCAKKLFWTQIPSNTSAKPLTDYWKICNEKQKALPKSVMQNDNKLVEEMVSE